MRRLDPSASTKPRRGRRAGLLLAVAALLGQVWIAAPHLTRELVSALVPAPRAVATARTQSAVGVQVATQPHDPATCPICQASALARSAVTSYADARSVGILSPALVVVTFGHDRLPSAPADPNTAPRAPPV